MGLLVSSLYLKIADLQKGESVIGISAYDGEENNLPKLSESVRARLFMDTEPPPKFEDMPRIEVLRCGWMERPARDTRPGIHSQPIGKLWVVYVYKESGPPRHEADETIVAPI